MLLTVFLAHKDNGSIHFIMIKSSQEKSCHPLESVVKKRRLGLN